MRFCIGPCSSKIFDALQSESFLTEREQQMVAQSTSYKQKPRKMPNSVVQGTRILGKTGGRPALLYRCAKSSRMCPAESPDEKGVGQAAGIDPRIRAISPQPLTIDLATGWILHTQDEVFDHRESREKSEARLREYTPDFRFDLLDGRRIIVEVKNRRYPGSADYWAKVEKAKLILEANGFRFQVIYIDYEASSALMHNVEILNALTTNSKSTITQSQIQVIEDDIGDAISSLGHVAKLAGMTIREAPLLVLHGVVSADISTGYLGSFTPVRLAHGDLAHLAVLNIDGDRK